MNYECEQSYVLLNDGDIFEKSVRGFCFCANVVECIYINLVVQFIVYLVCVVFSYEIIIVYVVYR